MLTLIKNLECYCPEYTGKNDILICGDKIYKIQPEIKCEDGSIINEIHDCGGLFAFPGLIDQHVHLIGGGGEHGFSGRITDIGIDRIVKAGISTVVGVLGADGVTKGPISLYAKAKGLTEQGVTAFMYSGSYTIPPVTVTGDVTRDLVLVDRVIGVKTALSDFRSSNVGPGELAKIASMANIGGMLSGKAGVVHIHIGDGRGGLSRLYEVLEKTDLPIGQFVVTHMNRSLKLLLQAEDFLKSGGNVDFTSGEVEGVPVPDAVERLLKDGININNLTVSSDGNAGMPGGGISDIGTLYEDIVKCIVDKGMPAQTAFCVATENVSKVLKLYPKKGALKAGSDADILITDSRFNIKMMFCMGKEMLSRIN